MNRNSDVWIFDVCGTLYDSNTTFDFLEYLFKKTNQSHLKRLRDIRNKKWLIYWVRAILFRYFNLDLFRKEAVRLLVGFDAEKVNSEAEVFLSSILLKKEIVETQQMLKDQKERIILVSNSIEPVVKAIANHLGKEFISTELEIKNGKFTGNILNDTTGKKHREIDKKGIKSYIVVTDNRSDYQLVNNASDAYVVINSEADKIFWNSLNPKFIFK
ncbi:HAD family hydrolase [Ekhidna sp.]|uniref:HAD family hydrolase n=1 Tax=Ekhidna sp. TaxID=2608089 RepID=UPI003B503D35